MKWHPTLVLLPGESHGWRSLVSCSPWGCKELDTTERLHSLTLWVCFCFINKSISILFPNILWYLLFSVWLTSLRMMISRSVHVTFATWLKKNPSSTNGRFDCDSCCSFLPMCSYHFQWSQSLWWGVRSVGEDGACACSWEERRQKELGKNDFHLPTSFLPFATKSQKRWKWRG